MRALSLTDHLFLLLESDNQPMHISGLCFFELPKNADANFVKKLVQQMATSDMPATAPFNQLLTYKAFWSRDDDFDINHHLTYHLLDDGSEETLMAYVSGQHSQILNRNHPLWECHVIDGLSPVTQDKPRRFAIYLKMHHAMADGVAAMRLFKRSLSVSPDAKFVWHFWSKNQQRHSKNPPKHRTIISLIKEQVGTIKPVAQEFIKRLKHPQYSNAISTFNTPPSILNQRISKSRLLITQSLEKQRFLSIAEHFQVSTNDVVLAVCAGALREYLSAQNCLPDTPLTAFVPISLRQDDSDLGNQLSFLLTNLATNETDAVTRLNTIRASIIDGKNRFSRMTQAQIINYSLISYGWAGINLATKLAPKKQGFNLIISNIPSDDTSHYLNGAKLTQIFPASVLLDGQALNITLANHQDKLDFGITACPITLPNIEKLPSLIKNQLLQYECLIDNTTQP
ncbi:wax ester/triacylglycerol synthase family O-acyltransferase [Moraxella oculi]|uniref:diacylglycerol O-acyltransferase n=1 Tax=Moraxella oculi TaxID=2940516 RepID=A0ABW8U758_9GAMM